MADMWRKMVEDRLDALEGKKKSSSSPPKKKSSAPKKKE